MESAIERKFSDRLSRADTQAIVEYIGGHQERFDELVRIFDRGDLYTRRWSAWPMSIVAEKHPELAKSHIGKLIACLSRKDEHDAVKRCITRLLQYVEVPSRLQGKVFSLCIDLVADPSEPIAVRCFALTAAARIARGRAPLMNELKMVADACSEHATAGLKVRIRRLRSEK